MEIAFRVLIWRWSRSRTQTASSSASASSAWDAGSASCAPQLPPLSLSLLLLSLSLPLSLSLSLCSSPQSSTLMGHPRSSSSRPSCRGRRSRPGDAVRGPSPSVIPRARRTTPGTMADYLREQPPEAPPLSSEGGAGPQRGRACSEPEKSPGGRPGTPAEPGYSKAQITQPAKMQQWSSIGPPVPSPVSPGLGIPRPMAMLGHAVAIRSGGATARRHPGGLPPRPGSARAGPSLPALAAARPLAPWPARL